MKDKRYSLVDCLELIMFQVEKTVSLLFSNDLNIHRTKTEKANDLWRNQIGNVLTPPNNPDHFDMSDTKAVRLETGKEKKDIMISGLGFITIEAGAKVIVRVPKNVDVILRNSIM